MTGNACIMDGCKNQATHETDEGGVCDDCLRLALDPVAKKAAKEQKRKKDAEYKAEMAFRGMDTEKRVQESLQRCKDAVGWRLWKVPTPAHYQTKSIADFVGFDAFGRSLALEAKGTVQKAFSIAKVPEHQITYMSDVEHVTGGDCSWILIDFKSVARWFMVPWAVFRLRRIAHPGDDWLQQYERNPLRFWETLR